MVNQIPAFPIPLVISLIARRKSSGELVITSRRSIRHLLFQSGKLDSASSDVHQEHLVEMLMLDGILTRNQAIRIKTTIGKGAKLKIGHLLVQQGILSEKKLYECLLSQAITIAANAFGLTEGQWKFRPEPESIPASTHYQISLPRVILEGVQQISDFTHYRNLFGRCVLKAARLPEKVKRLLSPSELKFLRLISGLPGKTVSQIVMKLPYPNDSCWREIVKLYLLRGLDFLDTDKWASTTETLIQAQVDLGKIREARPAPVRSRPAIREPDATAVPYEDRTEPHLSPPEPAQPAVVPESSSSQRSTTILFLMAERLYREGKYREAALLLFRTTRSETAPAAHLQLLGQCQARIPEMKEEAEKNLQLAVQREPASAEPLFVLADFFRTQERVQEAVAAYHQALKIYQGPSVQKSATKDDAPGRRRTLFSLRKK